jgi:hypothetical protein
MGVIAREPRVVVLALVLSACAPATTHVVTLRPPDRPPLRPAAECAEVRARVERGDVVAGRDTVRAPSPTRLPFSDPSRMRAMPRTGRLELSFFVSADGRVEPATMVAKGFEGLRIREEIIKEVLASPFLPAVLENCAVRAASKISMGASPYNR